MQQQPVTLVYLIISLLLVVYSAKLEQLQKNYLLSVRDGNCKKERLAYARFLFLTYDKKNLMIILRSLYMYLCMYVSASTGIVFM